MIPTIQLSIIIPVYNAAQTLGKCLSSIENQIFKEFEVLVIDGNSTDQSKSIAEQFLTKIPSLKIISESDTGIYDAMNKGITYAQGKWLYFIGADDVLYNEHVLQLLFVKRKSVFDASDIVYGNVLYKEFNTHSSYHANFDLLNFIETNVNHQALFYKKTVFESFGMYSLQYPVFADWEFNTRLFFSSLYKIIHIEEIVAVFSLKGASNTRVDSWIDHNQRVIYELIKKKPFFYRLKYFNKVNDQKTLMKKIVFTINRIVIKILQVLFKYEQI